MNNNSKLGQAVESLFRDNLKFNQGVVDKIRKRFKINGELLGAIKTGAHNEKADVKLEFSCGRNLDANVKSYKINFNQATRCSLVQFCEKFNLNCLSRLQDAFLRKAKNKNARLFSEEEAGEALSIFQPIAKEMVGWALSFKKSRELLVLHDNAKNEFYIYAMDDVLKRMDYSVSLTKKGNVRIGNLISFQRKGGNGKKAAHMDKTDLSHPGNNVQLKIKPKTLILELERYEIGRYMA